MKWLTLLGAAVAIGFVAGMVEIATGVDTSWFSGFAIGAVSVGILAGDE